MSLGRAIAGGLVGRVRVLPENHGTSIGIHLPFAGSQRLVAQKQGSPATYHGHSQSPSPSYPDLALSVDMSLSGFCYAHLVGELSQDPAHRKKAACVSLFCLRGRFSLGMFCLKWEN